ncbi:hypothetical protein EVAR_100717_1 [Eumeta japonica]|uniref:Uncharacterized protein n=1 Tax=Eumeta variegata TaxID=151549 RepID=A0A4C2A0X2_EUMVA|nr:hypothetical protein EVAR_100717_1 [Eumeta japonica]
MRSSVQSVYGAWDVFADVHVDAFCAIQPRAPIAPHYPKHAGALAHGRASSWTPRRNVKSDVKYRQWLTFNAFDCSFKVVR